MKENREDGRVVITRKTKEFQTVSARIRKSTLDKVNDIAQKSHMNRNEIIDLLLDWAADRCDVI